MRAPLFIRRPHLEEVFTTGSVPFDDVYVDRGSLDARVRDAQLAGSHMAIHGESKLGKTWLRARLLPEHSAPESPTTGVWYVRAQCTPGMTAEEAVASALGRMDVTERIALTDAETSEQEGEARLDVSGLSAGATSRHGASSSVDRRPVGQGAKDLGWIAERFRQARRRPVFEDFHNLSDSEQRRMAFTIKALGDWGVPCVVAGIWSDNHLLTFHDGELDGRIEDLHVRWTGDELEQVLHKGCVALNVSIAAPLVAALRTDAHSSPGLLQQLARELLREAHVGRRRLRTIRIEDDALYRTARDRVVVSIAGRFNPFVDRLHDHVEEGTRSGVFSNLLWVVFERASDIDLIEGVQVDRLVAEMAINDPGVRTPDLVAALERLDHAQRLHEVHPAVLAYDRVRGRLVLADRRLLLYRRRYSRAWPWQ